jgi:hypothetical protein
MVYPGDSASGTDFVNATLDSDFEIFLGTINED